MNAKRVFLLIVTILVLVYGVMPLAQYGGD